MLASRICEALAYLHGMKRPMLYLDLKPDNIIVTDDGLPHLIDFGIASWLAGRHLPVGTPGYSPPEQHLPDGRMDETSDIYAFGMTYYCMRHGVPPDPDPYVALGNIRHSKVLSLSERSLLTKCCAISKEDRYKTVTEVLRQISYIRSIPYRLKKRTVILAVGTGVIISSIFAGRAVTGRINQKESAAKLAEAATKHMEDGHYTPEGIGIIKACINSGNLSDECEQEFIFEVAVDSMLIEKDYRTAAAYFGRLDRNRYPEAEDYERLCLLQSGFDFDPDAALNLTGKLFTRIVQRAPSKMKYENMIFLAGCFENYEPDRRAGINKALSVLRIAGSELDGLEEKEEYSKLQKRIEDLISVKETRLDIYTKGDNHEEI